TAGATRDAVAVAATAAHRASTGHSPLNGRGHEDRGVVDATAAVGAAGGVDLITVVLVVRHPVDGVEGAVVVPQGTVVVVPELLQAFLFRRQALVALGEDIPPGLIAAVGQRVPSRMGRAAQRQAHHGGEYENEPLHRDSFHSRPSRPALLARPL